MVVVGVVGVVVVGVREREVKTGMIGARREKRGRRIITEKREG